MKCIKYLSRWCKYFSSFVLFMGLLMNVVNGSWCEPLNLRLPGAMPLRDPTPWAKRKLGLASNSENTVILMQPCMVRLTREPPS